MRGAEKLMENLSDYGKSQGVAMLSQYLCNCGFDTNAQGRVNWVDASPDK